MKFFDSLKQQLGKHSTRVKSPQQTDGNEPSEGSEYQAPLDYLKQLVPIGKLEDRQLMELKITRLSYEPGAIIFNRGETAESLIYLVSGEVYLETAGKQNLTIEAGTFDALHPLSCGDIRCATAICKKRSEVIYVPKIAIDLFRQRYNINPKRLLDLPEQYAGNALLSKFIASDNIVLPTLPDVAIKFRQAMQQDIGSAQAAKIISLDPAISTKLIQVANSPIYRTANSITTCLGAVTRIGLHSTKNIVTSISLRSLYRNKRNDLNVLAQHYWKQSIHISALSFTLASQTRNCDPEEALLAGLITNIGVVPFLRFADQQSDAIYSLDEVKSALPFVTGALSAMILNQWGFPDHMKNIPLETQTWFTAGGKDTADLSDVVLLAKYHSYLGSKNGVKLPPITSLPSYSYIKHAELTPDMSLKILFDAKQQVSEAMRFFTS